MTVTQLILKNKKKREKNKNFSRTSRLEKMPQLKGIILRLTVMTPKKPNSAIRNICKVTLYKNNRRLIGRVPGVGFLPTRYNRTLVEGGRANDLPTVRYTCIRGVYDFSSVYSKKRRRSIYGTPRPEGFTKHIRRCFRSIGYV